MPLLALGPAADAALLAARAAHAKRGIPFLEVFLEVPLSVVKARDPKGLYAKVAAGQIKNFTGIDSPFEPPAAPEIHLPTATMSLQQEVDALLDHLRGIGVVPAP